MFTGELKVGDRLIWRHRNPDAFVQVRVERIESESENHEETLVRVGTIFDWHCILAVRHLRRMCMRDTVHAVGANFDLQGSDRLCREWDRQEKTAAQQSQAAAENPNREPTGQDASIIPEP